MLVVIETEDRDSALCKVYLPLGWVDIGTRTKVPLKFVTYLSKITKINEKSV
jgi:hypothetical protein